AILDEGVHSVHLALGHIEGALGLLTGLTELLGGELLDLVAAHLGLLEGQHAGSDGDVEGVSGQSGQVVDVHLSHCGSPVYLRSVHARVCTVLNSCKHSGADVTHFSYAPDGYETTLISGNLDRS